MKCPECNDINDNIDILCNHCFGKKDLDYVEYIFGVYPVIRNFIDSYCEYIRNEHEEILNRFVKDLKVIQAYENKKEE